MITKKIILYSLLLLLSIVSCRKENASSKDNLITFSNFPKKDSIFFTEVYEYKEKGFPGELHLIDSTIVIFNAGGKQDYFLYNYSLKEDTLLKGYVRRGRGPNEILGGDLFRYYR
ncbi:hypothetical protein ACJOV8_017405 [Formosa sp. 3Alg 14/1]|uniref:hypothetical protein n=1 Tax=Formosa sp. 3Alg 14/1 TaxID=3382190 RepID=UPI0039BDCD0F